MIIQCHIRMSNYSIFTCHYISLLHVYTCNLCLTQGYISDLVGLVKGGVGEAEEAAVEAVGILSNLSIPELDFGKVVRDLQLLPFLMGRLRVCICVCTIYCILYIIITLSVINFSGPWLCCRVNSFVFLSLCPVVHCNVYY